MLVLRQERERRGWSLKYVADRTGMDLSAIAKIERQHVPVYPGWRRRLSELFGLPEEVLFEEVRNEHPASPG